MWREGMGVLILYEYVKSQRTKEGMKLHGGKHFFCKNEELGSVPSIHGKENKARLGMTVGVEPQYGGQR